jgi:hypothetical protein
MAWQSRHLRQIATWLLIVVVLAVGLAVAVSFAMNSAADDLRQQVRLASGQPLDHPRTPPGTWLSGPMVADLGPSDFLGVFARAEALDHRADRIRETAGAGSLVGLVVILLSARSDARADAPREASSPVASTRSNGTT